MKPRDDKKVEQIYKATLLLVTEKGLAGITMSEIAKEAGLATGTLYIYFKNKDELVNALLPHAESLQLKFILKIMILTHLLKSALKPYGLTCLNTGGITLNRQYSLINVIIPLILPRAIRI